SIRSFFFFSSRRRHTRFSRDWSSDVCSSDLAANLLAASPLNYIGFVEGDDIYSGKVDVVVCDGFIGNISLKSSEGVAKMIAHFRSEERRVGKECRSRWAR